MKASDLIKAHVAKGIMPAPSAAAIKELKALVDHNDTVPWKHKVPKENAIEMLRSMGWVGSRCAFDRMCKAQLGRGYGSK